MRKTIDQTHSKDFLLPYYTPEPIIVFKTVTNRGKLTPLGKVSVYR